MPNTPMTLIAGGTIRVSRLVKLSTTEDDTGLEAGANAEVVGVAYEGSNYAPLSDLVTTNNAATDGQEFRLYGPGDVCLVEAGDAITRGSKLKADSVGRAVAIASSGTTLQYFVGWALESATAAGEKIRCFVHPGSVYPALS